MESFFASLKKELVRGEDYATREDARASIFEYVQDALRVSVQQDEFFGWLAGFRRGVG